jgi:hypothetical protein
MSSKGDVMKNRSTVEKARALLGLIELVLRVALALLSLWAIFR